MALSIDERAESARIALYERYNKLNALWLKAEDKLTQYHLPHGANYEYCTDCDPDDCQPKVGHCLGVEKIDGKWRICHGSYSYHWHEMDIEWKPIVDCSALIRTDAVKGLPGLCESVVATSEKFIPRVDKAIENLEHFIGSDISHLLAERHKLNGKK